MSGEWPFLCGGGPVQAARPIMLKILLGWGLCGVDNNHGNVLSAARPKNCHQLGCVEVQGPLFPRASTTRTTKSVVMSSFPRTRAHRPRARRPLTCPSVAIITRDVTTMTSLLLQSEQAITACLNSTCLQCACRELHADIHTQTQWKSRRCLSTMVNWPATSD